MEQFRDMPTGGFNFLNCARNEHLVKNGFAPPEPIKTGTSIAGLIFKDGVILGADTRATGGTIVADKNCLKIHRLAKSVYCCGSGTAADADMLTNMAAAELEIHRLTTRRNVLTITANKIIKQHLYRYRGHIPAAFLVGGVDRTGFHLYSIHSCGSTDKVPYVTMGSGSLASMSVFEARFKPNMSESAGKKLVRDAIKAGILNDLGSGSNVDLCVIRKEETVFYRAYEMASILGQRRLCYGINPGRTNLLKKSTIGQFDIEEEVREVPSHIN